MRPALEEIVKQARDKQLVIINEAHTSPPDRAFILQLAHELRALGFEYYAFEALNESAQTLNSRGYPTRGTGFYTQEPVFANLVRGALQLGYQPVAYEAMFTERTGDQAKDIDTRERGQAKNLIDRVLADNPQAKMLIHVGHDHVMEEPRELGETAVLWMAARLKEETGIDPLTIDQTTRWNVSEEEMDRPEQPAVLATQDGYHSAAHFAGMVDMQVYHPAVEWIDGRPSWLQAQAGRAATEIPSSIEAVDDGRVLVQAFLTSEYDQQTTRVKAIPADQVLLVPGQPRPKLLLRPGRYQLVTQDEAGTETVGDVIEVEAAQGQE